MDQINSNIPMSYQYGPSPIQQLGQVMSLGDMLQNNRMRQIQLSQMQQHQAAEQQAMQGYQKQLQQFQTPPAPPQVVQQQTQPNAAIQSQAAPLDQDQRSAVAQQVMQRYNITDPNDPRVQQIMNNQNMNVSQTNAPGAGTAPYQVPPAAANAPVQVTQQQQQAQVPPLMQKLGLGPDEYKNYLRIASVDPETGTNYLNNQAELALKAGQAGWYGQRMNLQNAKAGEIQNNAKGLALKALGIDFSSPQAQQQVQQNQDFLVQHGWDPMELQAMSNDPTGKMGQSYLNDYNNSVQNATVNQKNATANQNNAGAGLKTAQAGNIPTLDMLAQERIDKMGLNSPVSRGPAATIQRIIQSNKDWNLQNNKVSGATHAMGLLDQVANPDGTFNVNSMQAADLAMNLANIVSNSNISNVETFRAMNPQGTQSVIVGQINKALGTNYNTLPQNWAKLIQETIARQGAISQALREKYVNNTINNINTTAKLPADDLETIRTSMNGLGNDFVSQYGSASPTVGSVYEAQKAGKRIPVGAAINSSTPASQAINSPAALAMPTSRADVQALKSGTHFMWQGIEHVKN
jgi:hypothetical protein